MHAITDSQIRHSFKHTKLTLPKISKELAFYSSGYSIVLLLTFFFNFWLGNFQLDA